VSRRVYAPEERANALVHLEMNAGDIILTARQLGIPERTLYTWRRQWYAENQRRQTPPPSSPIQHPDFEDDLDALAYLRKQIMAELLEIAGAFREGTAFTTPTQRIHLLSQLLDRLMKLDQHLKPYKPRFEPRIVFAWDCGLYLRTPEGYLGPYTPVDLPRDWKEMYGPSTRLEIYWGDDTFTILPDGSDIQSHILNVKDFREDPCELAPDSAEKKRGTWYP
jgi:transposase-like protein